MTLSVGGPGFQFCLSHHFHIWFWLHPSQPGSLGFICKLRGLYQLTSLMLSCSKHCTCVKWKKEAATTKGIRRSEGDAFVSGKQSKRRAEYGRKIKGSYRRPSSQWGPGRCANPWLGNLEMGTEVNSWNQMRQKHVENSCIWHLPSLWEN